MTKKTQFVTPYGDRQRQQFATEGESLTQQHFQKECDIKEIIKRHDRTGLITHVARGVAQYGDYSEVHEFREAMDLINNAQESFDGLPSDIRRMFGNDPGEFFEFATNPENAERMVELGLAPPPPEPFTEVLASGTPAKAGKKASAESVDTDKSED